MVSKRANFKEDIQGWQCVARLIRYAQLASLPTLSKRPMAMCARGSALEDEAARHAN